MHVLAASKHIADACEFRNEHYVSRMGHRANVHSKVIHAASPHSELGISYCLENMKSHRRQTKLTRKALPSTCGIYLLFQGVHDSSKAPASTMHALRHLLSVSIAGAIGDRADSEPEA